MPAGDAGDSRLGAVRLARDDVPLVDAGAAEDVATGVAERSILRTRPDGPAARSA